MWSGSDSHSINCLDVSEVLSEWKFKESQSQTLLMLDTAPETKPKTRRKQKLTVENINQAMQVEARVHVVVLRQTDSRRQIRICTEIRYISFKLERPTVYELYHAHIDSSCTEHTHFKVGVIGACELPPLLETTPALVAQ